MNKKGVIPLFFLALALFIGLGISIGIVWTMAPELDFVGETALNIIAAQEIEANSFDYLDHSIRIASLSAVERMKKEDMLLLEKFEEHKCGEVAYPVFGRDCNPDWENNYLKYFEQEFSKTVRQSFYSGITRTGYSYELNNNALLVKSTSPISTPIRRSMDEYHNRESGYRFIPNFGRTPGHSTVEGFSMEQNYFQRLGLVSNPRTSEVNKIIIYEENKSALDLFNKLQEQGRSYHYFIDEQGRTFNFVPESMIAYHVTCEEGCEGYDETSIVVSIQPCSDCEARDDSLRRLLNRITENNRDLELNQDSIILYSDFEERTDEININTGDLLR